MLGPKDMLYYLGGRKGHASVLFRGLKMVPEETATDEKPRQEVTPEATPPGEQVINRL